jgi:hypothetical protein
MKKLSIVLLLIIVPALAGALAISQPASSMKPEGDGCFFRKSLHYTAHGMGYWYAKEQGGLETITGIPYEKLGCKNCHTDCCDRCHKVEKMVSDCKRASYSTERARNQDVCLSCHGREKTMIRVNHKNKQDDVHLANGMQCMDCHSAREMHGDGTPYKSLKQPGAMDTKCENCHDPVKPTESHSAHQGKLDCKACHIRHVVSCTNCHFDTLVKKGKRKAVPVWGWLFLMNIDGKVSSASMQTFVAGGKKTFLIFAPHMSHAVMKKGRACKDCHESANVKQALKGNFKLTWLKDGKVMNAKGVIPVSDAVDYKCAYLDRDKDGKWVPIKNPDKPKRQYVAFGKPLSKEQMKKLSKMQEAPAPRMK